MLMLQAAAAIAGLALTASAGYVVDHERSMLKDGQGRLRLFHGMNIVQKSAPFHPQLDSLLPGLSVTEADIDTLLSMGSFVVRLGVMMPGMFPDGPSLNTTYLDVIEKIIDRLYQHGIETIIDLHQDVLAPKLCGEGTPDWMLDVDALRAMPLPRPVAAREVDIDPATGHPRSCQAVGVLKSIGWSEWYMSDQCGKAFAQLYSGEGPMAQAFAAYWREVGQRFRGHPGVMAYELLNEPWLGDHVRDPALLMEGGKAEAEVGKYMRRMHDIIRAVDPDTLILYAPAELNNRLMRRVGYESGFLPEAAMAYHVYCVVGTDGDGPRTTLQKELCHFNDGFSLKQRSSDLRRLRTAGFVTEFGAVSPSVTGLAEVDFVLGHFDAMQPPTSWAFWDFGEVMRQNSTSRRAYLSALARAYPRAVAGDLDSFRFDAATGAFELAFRPAGEGATEIFLPTRYRYPASYEVSATPAGAVAFNDTAYGIEVRATTAAASGGGLVRIKVVERSGLVV